MSKTLKKFFCTGIFERKLYTGVKTILHNKYLYNFQDFIFCYYSPYTLIDIVFILISLKVYKNHTGQLSYQLFQAA